jgi:hypothetical protein
MRHRADEHALDSARWRASSFQFNDLNPAATLLACRLKMHLARFANRASSRRTSGSSEYDESRPDSAAFSAMG